MDDKLLTCGIDEAGRGALAGPLVAASVVLSPSHQIALETSDLPILDSKILTAHARKVVYDFLLAMNLTITVRSYSVNRINRHGIGRTNRQIIRELIRDTIAQRVVVDGNLALGAISGHKHIECIIDADATILPVILAGIVAKVERDAIMHDLHGEHPAYGWDRNAGYGTAHHLKAILASGTTEHHRTAFVDTALSHAPRQALDRR